MSTATATISTPRRIIRFTDRVIDKGLTILFLILLALGAYFAYDSWYVFNASALDSIPGYNWQGPKTLAELPEDAIAWITVDDTKIDCPIMQGETNSEYLNKNPYGDYSLSGSVFLDASNAKDFSDLYSLLYGHHMSGGYMFGALDAFLKEGYFDAHRTGVLTLRENNKDGARIPLNIFAVVETDASEEVVFNVALQGDIRSFVKANAKIYREPEAGKRVLALSTCKSPLTTERLVVFATLSDTHMTEAEYEAYKVEHPSAKDAALSTAGTNYGGADAVPGVRDSESIFARIWRWIVGLFAPAAQAA